MRTTTMRAAPLVLALTVLAACGSGDDGEGGAGDTLPALSGDPGLPTLPAVSAAPSAPGGSAPPGSPPPVATGAAASTVPASAGSTTPQEDPEIELADAVSQPGLVKVAAGQVGRTYVVAKAGVVSLLGDSGPVTALDLTGSVSGGSEQGLLGLAVHPSQPFAYVNYTDTSGDTVVAEYRVNPDGTFDAASAREVLEVDQPFENHNGGNLVFGPDDYLYIGMGDGGSAGDPQRLALNLSQRLGKLLRIDPLATDGFNVPADNPYVGTQDALGEIWASGLRNPWRFSFDPANGNLWIADVGQNAIEEIHLAGATGGFAAGKGLSFGWSAFEGNDRFNDDQPEDGHTPPYYTYGHENGRCSITGGVVYRGSEVPALDGWYVFADYCSGEVFAFDAETFGVGEVLTLATVPSPVSIDQVGETLYIVSATDGALRVTPAG